MNSPRITALDCWAKTDPATHLPALSIVDHSINVGAVAECICKVLPECLTGLLIPGSVSLVALHDVGKYSPGFLMKCGEWRSKWQPLLNLDSPKTYEQNHAKASQSFLSERLAAAKTWAVAIGGHHGSYTGDGLMDAPSETWQTTLQAELIEHVEGIWGVLPSGPKVQKGPFIHWFTGLIIFCDWIGSNTKWFPLNQVGSYPLAQLNALRAIDDIGWHRRKVLPDLKFSQLFRSSASPGFDPRPLQSQFLKAIDKPGLYIIEAPMGEGKTEAALAGAYKRWTQGEERGLYFGLPTQLTSNRIHHRVESFLTNIIDDESTLALVHGNAWISDHKMTALSPANSSENDSTDVANYWYCESRKSLLAPFGVGTIDQALMAVLPVKFAALRLFALAGKVVVFDEVHSYDPYTSAFLDRCVEWLLSVKSTVIILSATLTESRRAALIAAAKGSSIESHAYPLITKVTSQVTEVFEVSEPIEPKTVEVEFQDAAGSGWLDRVAEAAERGACVLVIRNTVKSAQESYRQIKSQCRDGVMIGLLHSRFSQADRGVNEGSWIDRLGKDGASRPKGCVLVGTQVLEQSLDIDSDLLISDLAPTDLLLQRIGRLHRHQRIRPEGFSKPRCVILSSPVDWSSEDLKEIKKSLGPSSFIYPGFSLYMSEITWRAKKHIVVPNDIRSVLESSSTTPFNPPPAAVELLRELKAKTSKMTSTAWHQQVFKAPSADDEEETQTRWNSQPTGSVILLARRPVSNGNMVSLTFRDESTIDFVPGFYNFRLAKALLTHSVRVSLFYIKDMLDKENSWLYQHVRNSVLVVCPSDSLECVPVNSVTSPNYELSYTSEWGLQANRTTAYQQTPQTEEETWF